MKHFLIITLSILAFSLFAGKVYIGKVVWLYDGDSFVLKSKGKRLEVRMWGVDAPEKKQKGGYEALKFMIKLLKNKTVKVKEVAQDSYGRIVGKVYLGNIFVNLKLLENGHAWWYRHYAPKQKDFAKAEADARKAKKGLWANPNPINPRDFRRAAKGKYKR